MGQKVNPKGFRIGVFREWDARWYPRSKSYGTLLLEDLKLRNFIQRHLSGADIGRIEIERAGDNLRIVLHVANPGLVIGRKGKDITTLRENLSKLVGLKNVEVSVQEIKKPELNANVVAKNIADQLERRASFKKVMKRASLAAMKSGARGINIRVSGRIGGAEIAREEWIRVGSIPRHTIREDIDYGFAKAYTTYGIIGVTVWISRGEFKSNIKG